MNLLRDSLLRVLVLSVVKCVKMKYTYRTSLLISLVLSPVLTMCKMGYGRIDNKVSGKINKDLKFFIHPYLSDPQLIKNSLFWTGNCCLNKAINGGGGQPVRFLYSLEPGRALSIEVLTWEGMTDEKLDNWVWGQSPGAGAYIVSKLLLCVMTIFHSWTVVTLGSLSPSLNTTFKQIF